MLIQKAEHNDLPDILVLQYTAYQSEARLLNNFDIPPLKQSIAEVEAEYAKGTFLKAVDSNGEIVGSVRAYETDGTVHVGKLIVHPDRQRQGIGTALLLAVEGACPAQRYELFTSDKSQNNLRLYEKNGYVRFREKEVGPGLRFVYLEKSMAVQ